MVPIIRIIVLRGLYGGSPYLGKLPNPTPALLDKGGLGPGTAQQAAESLSELGSGFRV